MYMLVHAGTHVLSCVKVLKFSTRSGYMYYSCTSYLVLQLYESRMRPRPVRGYYGTPNFYATYTHTNTDDISIIESTGMHACMHAGDPEKLATCGKSCDLLKNFRRENIREHSRTFENIREHFPGEKNSRRENFSALER